MSRHLIVEESRLAKLVADAIAGHLKNNGVVLSSRGRLSDDDGTAAEIAIAADLFVKAIVDLGYVEVVDIEPGDRLARMSDVHAAVKSIVAEMRL